MNVLFHSFEIASKSKLKVLLLFVAKAIPFRSLRMPINANLTAGARKLAVYKNAKGCDSLNKEK